MQTIVPALLLVLSLASCARKPPAAPGSRQPAPGEAPPAGATQDEAAPSPTPDTKEEPPTHGSDPCEGGD